MSKIDDIWEAYYKGQAALENDDVLSIAFHNIFGHAIGAMIPGGDSDEELAFEKGYHGDDLEICEECEHVQENCECEKDKDDGYSDVRDSSSDDGGDNSSYSSGGGGDSSYGGSSYAGSGGGGASYYDGSGSSSSGCLAPLILAVVVIGGIYFGLGWISSQMNNERGESNSTGRNNTVGTLKRVNTINLNMRSGPGEEYPIVKVFPQDSRIVSYGETRQVGKTTWTQASTDNGQIRGWVNSKYLSDKEATSSKNNQHVAPTKNERTAPMTSSHDYSPNPNSRSSTNTQNSTSIQTHKDSTSDSRVSDAAVKKRDAAAKLFDLIPNGDGTYTGPGCDRCRLIKAKGNGYTMEH